MYHRPFARISATLLICSSFVLTAQADVTLPSLIRDHMVLQRDRPVAVWGWAEPGEKVRVSIAGQFARTTTGDDGKWTVQLDAMPAGGPHKMTIKGANSLTVEDVLVGEVWLCSGQSNMAFLVKSAANPDEEIAAANHPGIRMLTVAQHAAMEPETDCEGEWQVCSPETVGGFSAVGYYFGRTLHQELDVPIGLIKSAWGGTAVEAWSDLGMQRTLPALKPIHEPWDQQVAEYTPESAQAKYEAKLANWETAKVTAEAKGRKTPKKPAEPTDPRVNQNYPGALYNGMICPLVPYGIRGAIWYQGERNSHDEKSRLYGLQLRTLIGNWRADFGQGDFPFLFVQLPNYMAPQELPSENTGWVHVREQMLRTLKYKNTGIAVTIDIGEEKNIHPKNKQDVGARLARWALANTYGQETIACGPLYSGMSKNDGKITVRFAHPGTGLKTSDGEAPTGFAIAGADKQFVWADAVIRGSVVVVSCPDVADPVAVRYAWANNPKCNVVNSADLPASPFRTDDWVEEVLGR